MTQLSELKPLPRFHSQTCKEIEQCEFCMDADTPTSEMMRNPFNHEQCGYCFATIYDDEL